MSHFRVSDDISDHPQFIRLSHLAFRLWVYCGAWCQRHLTDGRIPQDVALMLPHAKEKALDELVQAALFVVDGGDFVLAGFLKHNDSRETVHQRRGQAAARLARWRDRNGVSNGVTTTVTSALTTLPLTSPHLTSVDLKNRSTKDTHAPKAREVPAGFMAFWDAYPRKIGKGAALSAWKRYRPELEIVAKALSWQSESEQWQREGGRFIPHPATWLRQQRWLDEPEAVAPEPEHWRDECRRIHGGSCTSPEWHLAKRDARVTA